MNDYKGEGVAIANLIGTDGCSIVGWVYRWSTGELAVMWRVEGKRQVLDTLPGLSVEQQQEIDLDGLRKLPDSDGG